MPNQIDTIEAGSTGGSTSTAGAGPARAKPAASNSAADWAQIAHRALRGRYRLTVASMLLAGGIGVGAAWKLAGPVYCSEGMVRIASSLPAVIKETDQNKPIPMFDSFIQAQQEMVTSRSVLNEAIHDSAWSKAPANERPSIEQLAARLKVELKPRSENIRISYTDPNPVIATAAVSSTIEAFQKVYIRDHKQIEQQRMQLLEDYRKSLANQLDLAQGNVAAPTTAAPGPTSQPSDQTSITPPVNVLAPPVGLTPERLALNDAEMRKLLDDRTRAQDDLEQTEIVYGPNHRAVQQAQVTLEQASDNVDQYLTDYLSAHIATMSTASAPATQPSGASVAIAQPIPVQPPQLSASMLQVKSELDDVTQRLEVLKTEAAMPKRFEIVSIGDIPTVVQDRRIKAAAIGGFGAGILPLGVMLMLGLLRRRYNCCAEVTDDLAARLPFIAAIPEIDGDATAQQSDDAARCVHHLREALKQDSRTILLTSAGHSEGRTNLAMSLAISLSASGSRTLLIDADIVTSGLSAKLQVKGAPGFYDALRGGDVASYLRKSKSGAYFLPVGQAGKSDAIAISASAVGAFLQKLNEHFDVILIDSGPLLSCVETSVIARQVQGVLLTVARGQQKGLVRDTLKKLAGINARVLGAVFNRAQPRDFYRSIKCKLPEVSKRKQGSLGQILEALGDFGPLVHAVERSLGTDSQLISTNAPANGVVNVASNSTEEFPTPGSLAA